jgi:large subunit ribosomal protein L4
MFVKIYNQKGEETGKTKLPSEIFDVEMNQDLVHQIVVSQMGNRRQVSAHTKTKGDVRGGGRKPWRQKGTGRARAGSRRSPIWKGGGVTFGPTKERNFKKIIPQKMRRKALFMVLTQKAKDNELIILDELKLEKTKTKEMAKIINNQSSIKLGSILIALPKMDENVIRASRNIPKIATIPAKDLNCLGILSYKYLMLPKEAIKVIKDTFVKSK